MTFEQVAEYVTTSIGELYQAQCLDELLQRELTSNYSAIKEYLLNDEERFFNALILAIYDGDPQWLEIEFENHDFCNVGFLQFSGKEVIFPVDGQHRPAAGPGGTGAHRQPAPCRLRHVGTGRLR